MSAAFIRLCQASFVIALAIAQVACATTDCDREAKEVAATSGAEQAAEARQECEDRLAKYQRELKEAQKDREAEERRDAFRHRNEARR